MAVSHVLSLRWGIPANSQRTGAHSMTPNWPAGRRMVTSSRISGCDGTHYKIVAEPAVLDSGQRAFCSDDSGAVRAAADGQATTCLASGEPVPQGHTLIAPRVD